MPGKVIAIITARGGSKRIPKKNIKLFLGEPIIKYSINAALKANIFNEVMVSTDDLEIAAIAKANHATIPFLRSAINSNDHATTADVLVEILNTYKLSGKEFDYACCIYPTAPFVTGSRLQQAFNILKEKNADSVIPVTRFSFPIWRSFKIENERIAFNWPENSLKRSQDLSPAFHDCGQFYFFNVNRFMHSKKLVTENTIPIEIPELEVQDIDNETDWKIAEIKYSIFLQKNNFV